MMEDLDRMRRASLEVFLRPAQELQLLKLINLGCRFVAAVKAHEAFRDWVSYINRCGRWFGGVVQHSVDLLILSRLVLMGALSSLVHLQVRVVCRWSWVSSSP